ncbi:MAG: hypothetical protein M3Y35_05085 [Actinomycetota bacterium]|nr:hypothetical protein [Actinomycetota bacterium]
MAIPGDGLLFGIYPGGVAGDDAGGWAGGPPDDPDLITAALDRLQGHAGRPFLVRAYLAFTDDTRSGVSHPTSTPTEAARYATGGRSLDLVAQYQSRRGDVAGYFGFVGELVAEYGAVTATLQITEEPNVTGNRVLDGDYPRVTEAIIAGVTAAKQEARRLGQHHLRVGFNTTPLFGPAASFVTDLAGQGGQSFVDDLDYVGLDFFPDVFRPVAADDLAAATEGLLRYHRDTVLAPGGLGEVSMHITEHGWPTGPDRSPDRQAEVIEIVIGVAAAVAKPLRLSGYTHFSLRDADSAQQGLFHQFGLTRDDYIPKPALDTYRLLINQLSA